MGLDELALVIDKNAETRKKLSRICRLIGIDVQSSASWPEALLRLKRRYYDIVIVGLDTAGDGATDMIQMIRRIGLDSCIIITAPFKKNSLIAKCLKVGAYDTILKPINPEWARIVISRALERRLYYDDAQKKNHYWKLSVYDELTRIHNHRYFHYMLTKAVNTAQRYCYPLSLLMMDLDNFKKYNDSYGHIAGDEVLRSLGVYFPRAIRAGDMVARYGGEEFAMILPHTNKAGARSMAEKLRSEVERMEFSPAGGLPHARLTISIGVASFPVDAKTKDELIKVADIALYRAKHADKNKVCCGKSGK